ncbi:MAG: hypothetical protein KAS66_11600 [Candidatus Omnitrophica bacterium]|nr:hypothetical protein [Candidatus Omnitrophota bacterium]
MTREDIYDHLAQVYLGKRSKADIKKERQFSVWLLINILITVIIFTSAFYGLTAFLTHRNSALQSRIIFSLHNGPIRIAYNFTNSFPPVKTFALDVPAIDAAKYNKIQFSIRGKEEGTPGIVKIVVKNRRSEEASYYIQGVGLDWQEFHIPLNEFQQITDWSSLTDVSFVLESWNVESKKGLVLVDGVCFSS